MKRPSVVWSVAAEIPVTIFFNFLLAFWLLSIVLVRKTASQLNARTATLKDLTGEVSRVRLTLLVLFCNLAWVCQNVLHFMYLRVETNRAVFSSFRHFETSAGSSPTDVRVAIMIVVNSAILLVYALLFIYGFISNLAHYKRLELFQQVGQLG